MLSDEKLRQVLLDKGMAMAEAEAGFQFTGRLTPNEAVLAVLMKYGRAVEAAVLTTPIDMVLHCPACGLQHIDAEEHDHPHGWDNLPHRSHLCGGCGHVWRPADVPTNGVPAVHTKGKNDSPVADVKRHMTELCERIPERIAEFAEGQWWVAELDAMVATGGTGDQQRAVAVVHRLLREIHHG